MHSIIQLRRRDACANYFIVFVAKSSGIEFGANERTNESEKHEKGIAYCQLCMMAQLRDIDMKTKEDSDNNKYKQILVHQFSTTPATQSDALAHNQHASKL